MLGILISLYVFPPAWFESYTAKIESNKTPITEVPSESAVKPLVDSNRLYHNVLITTEGLKEALSAEFSKYGIADQLGIAEKIITCESNWNVLADNGISYGILQFTKPTWEDFGQGDIFNPYAQIEVTAKIVKKEGWKRWDCYKRLDKGL